jgi:hypothetical protein
MKQFVDFTAAVQLMLIPKNTVNIQLRNTEGGRKNDRCFEIILYYVF